MADALKDVNLSELHQKIILAFSEHFASDFNLIAFYREQDERRAPKESELPALLFELTEMEPDFEEDAGGEQLPVIARFEARVVVNAMLEHTALIDTAKVKVRGLAGKVAHYLFKHRRFHKLHTGPLNIHTIVEDAFYPELDRFEVWRVDFSIPVNIGESVWFSDAVIPTQVFYSWTPQVGKDNDQSYQEIQP